MKYKAVFIDMDGTLLRKDHTVSSITKQTIQRLMALGVLVVPISARPLHGMFPITNEIFPDSNPIVSLNGSYIYQTPSVLFQVHVSLQDTIKLHAEIDKYPVSVMYYNQMEWYAKANTDAVKKEQKITPVPVNIGPFRQMLSQWETTQSGPNKILIAGDTHLILSIEQHLLTNHHGQLNIYKSQPRYLEIMNLQASKSNAVKQIIEKYGIQQNEIIAIGDNYNDMGMIEFAGVGIAMGNAPNEIKDIADYVTDTNNNDGVNKALNHYFDIS